MTPFRFHCDIFFDLVGARFDSVSIALRLSVIFTGSIKSTVQHISCIPCMQACKAAWNDMHIVPS
jgi:hypothetical protein